MPRKIIARNKYNMNEKYVKYTVFQNFLGLTVGAVTSLQFSIQLAMGPDFVVTGNTNANEICLND